MSNIKYLLEATRPKTLPASATPVLVGTSLAFYIGTVDWTNFALILVCAVFIQIVTNFVNEIYDSKKGADTPDRVGPRRMVASGLITPSEMKKVSAILALSTLLIGLVVVARTDLNVLWIGLASLFFGWLYTGGPYPLAYNGLGDVFVFVFFGLVAVCGSYYVHTATVTELSVLTALAPGFLITNILGVNNYRDLETDTRAGKRTLSVILGRRAAFAMFVCIEVAAYAVPVLISLFTGSVYALLPILSVPMGINLVRSLNKKSGQELNPVLASAGKLVFVHGLLTSVGFILMKLL